MSLCDVFMFPRQNLERGTFDSLEDIQNVILEYFSSHYRYVRMTVKKLQGKYSESDYTD
jgi:hypothetical protein